MQCKYTLHAHTDFSIKLIAVFPCFMGTVRILFFYSVQMVAYILSSNPTP